MEIENWLNLFKARGFTLSTACQRRLEEEFLNRVNDAVERKKRQKEEIKEVEMAGKVYMRSLARAMMHAARERDTNVLEEEDLDVALRELGPLPPLD